MIYPSLTENAEFIPVDPKTDFLFGAPLLPQNDIPTVAELFPPYATEKISTAQEPVYKTYGELWKAYFYNSAFYPEM